METIQAVRKVSEVSDARLSFLRELMENEVVVPEKDIQVLEGFLVNLGLKHGYHFSVSHVRVWFLFEWKWWGRFRLLRSLRVREIQRRGYNRTKIEVVAEDIFAVQQVPGA